MDFKPSKADPDKWMKLSKDGTYHECIAVYVDDLAICMQDPQAFCETLKEECTLKLKGVRPISYHLDVLRKYVVRILESNEKMFGEKTKNPGKPLVAGDHPENDL